MLDVDRKASPGSLNLVTNGFSRKIVGHHVHDSLQTRDLAASSNGLI